MPRSPRHEFAGVAQHVIQRGNNRTPCFFVDTDRYAFLHWLADLAGIHDVAIHAYVLMNNHVHLLATPGTPRGVSAMMQALGRRYVPYINRKHARSGTLWEGRFKACVVEGERYVLAAHRYIDLNPVRAGIVDDPAAYPWSSYSAHADLRREPWLRPHQTYLALGETAADCGTAYRALCRDAVDPDDLWALRTATAKQQVCGNRAILKNLTPKLRI